MNFSKYFLNLLAATILPSVLAAVAVVTCSLVTGLLKVGVTAATYQRIGAAFPFVVQTLFGLLLGLFLSMKIDVKSARWVWVIPIAWMLVGIVTWRPVVVPNLSPWDTFSASSGCNYHHRHCVLAGSPTSSRTLCRCLRQLHIQ
jgi:hypothetical protein